MFFRQQVEALRRETKHRDARHLALARGELARGPLGPTFHLTNSVSFSDAFSQFAKRQRETVRQSAFYALFAAREGDRERFRGMCKEDAKVVDVCENSNVAGAAVTPFAFAAAFAAARHPGAGVPTRAAMGAVTAVTAAIYTTMGYRWANGLFGVDTTRAFENKERFSQALRLAEAIDDELIFAEVSSKVAPRNATYEHKKEVLEHVNTGGVIGTYRKGRHAISGQERPRHPAQHQINVQDALRVRDPLTFIVPVVNDDGSDIWDMDVADYLYLLENKKLPESVERETETRLASRTVASKYDGFGTVPTVRKIGGKDGKKLPWVRDPLDDRPYEEVRGESRWVAAPTRETSLDAVAKAAKESYLASEATVVTEIHEPASEADAETIAKGKRLFMEERARAAGLPEAVDAKVEDMKVIDAYSTADPSPLRNVLPPADRAGKKATPADFFMIPDFLGDAMRDAGMDTSGEGKARAKIISKLKELSKRGAKMREALAAINEIDEVKAVREQRRKAYDQLEDVCRAAIKNLEADIRKDSAKRFGPPCRGLGEEAMTGSRHLAADPNNVLLGSVPYAATDFVDSKPLKEGTEERILLAAHFRTTGQEDIAEAIESGELLPSDVVVPSTAKGLVHPTDAEPENRWEWVDVARGAKLEVIREEFGGKRRLFVRNGTKWNDGETPARGDIDGETVDVPLPMTEKHVEMSNVERAALEEISALNVSGKKKVALFREKMLAKYTEDELENFVMAKHLADMFSEQPMSFPHLGEPKPLNINNNNNEEST